MKYVIALNRQFGSLGRQVAQRVAALLEIEYYDRDIVEATSKKIGVPVSKISDYEESHGGRFLGMQFPLGNGNDSIKDEIFDEQEKIIMSLADKGSCIIVGRCADYVLRNNENVLNVFIYASYGSRIKNAVDVLNLEAEEALKRIKGVDKARDNYHLRYAKYLPNDMNHIHVMLDSGTLGVEGTAQAIVKIAKDRFKLE
ncbi:MAG: cytidylate kinase-like family protein [Lachnospiraceae bacterium]|nr:cytidylate kinase-like family protein [Candidatus Colinaster scatohippi]